MPIDRPRLVYLCADRGIPLGGLKGASVHVGEFIHALRGAQIDVHTVAARYASSEPPGPACSSLSAHESAWLPFLDAAQGPQGDKQALREARDFLLNAGVAAELARLQSEADIDFVYERYSLFCMAGRSFAARHAIPYLLEVNSPLILEAEQFRQLRSRDLAECVARYLFATADHVLAVSRANADYIRGLAPDARVTVLPNGVDPQRFESAYSNVRQRLKQIPSEFVIGFVGSVRPWHGVERLIEAFALFARTDATARLRVVGDDGAAANDLRRQCAGLGIQDRVEFTGAVAFDSIPQYLSALDVAVAPYPALEPFYFSPLKVFEYMAAGLPIVASAIGQVGEVLEHNRTAILVPPGDVESLARAFQTLRQDRALRQRLSEAARAEAAGEHSWQARLVTLKDIMADVSQRRPHLRGAARAGKI